MAKTKQAPFTTADLPDDLTACKADELRTYVERLGSAAKAHLSGPVSKAKKADLVAALEWARAEAGGAKKVGGKRSFTDEQAQEAVRLRHEDLLSWRAIADALGLGTPGVARRAYRTATGLPVSTPLPRIAGKPGRPTAGMVAGTAQPEILGGE